MISIFHGSIFLDHLRAPGRLRRPRSCTKLFHSQLPGQASKHQWRTSLLLIAAPFVVFSPFEALTPSCSLSVPQTCLISFFSPARSLDDRSPILFLALSLLGCYSEKETLFFLSNCPAFRFRQPLSCFSPFLLIFAQAVVTGTITYDRSNYRFRYDYDGREFHEIFKFQQNVRPFFPSPFSHPTVRRHLGFADSCQYRSMAL